MKPGHSSQGLLLHFGPVTPKAGQHLGFSHRKTFPLLTVFHNTLLAFRDITGKLLPSGLT